MIAEGEKLGMKFARGREGTRDFSYYIPFLFWVGRVKMGSAPWVMLSILIF